MNKNHHIPPGFKLSPIGLIPNDWDLRELGELGKFKKGKGIQKEQIIETGLPCFLYGEIYTTHDFIIKNVISYISEKTAKESQEVNTGDILFTGSGETIEEIGKSVAYVFKHKAFAGGDIIILSPSDQINSEFLTYALETDIARKQKRRLGQGFSVVHIYSSDLTTIKIPLPPLPEQTAIVNLLSTWDKAIGTTQKLIVQKELHKKWLMQVLLTGKKRVKGYDKEWKEYHLVEMFSERNEIRYNHLQLLSVGQNGIYPQTESDKKNTSNEDKSKYRRICIGDIGYNTMRMWQGRSSLSSFEGIVSPAYTIVTPTEKANSHFFAYLFKTPKMMNLFWRNSQGLVEDTLNCRFKDFSLIKAYLPKKEEQTAIAQILSSADKEIQLLKTRLDKLKEQKKGLMQVLLTGRKRLKTE
jgi:type I restriction enzyme S subunit